MSTVHTPEPLAAACPPAGTPTADTAPIVAVCGPHDAAAAVIAALRADGRLGVVHFGTPDELPRPAPESASIAAVVLAGRPDEAWRLPEDAARLCARLADPSPPVFVQDTAPLPPEVRAALRRLGITGPCCRDGQSLTTLAEDVLHVIEVASERRALVAITTFSGNRLARTTLTEMAISALAFLRENGIGTAGGIVGFFRPTSEPEWMVVAGSGEFEGTHHQPASALPAGLRRIIEYAPHDPCARNDERSLTLHFVTIGGSHVCLHLKQTSALLSWHREVVAVFRDRLAAVVDEVMQKRRIERTQHASIATLATLSEYRDVDTGNHVSRVSRIAMTVAQSLIDQGLPEDEARDLVRYIGHASILHDIGKVGIPDTILLKPGALEQEERRIMQTHAHLGHEILSKTAMISDWPALMTLAASVARSHHERYDGTGYPDGLAGEDIPLAARIVAIVDVFDALVSERPYKQPWPEEKALDFIAEQSGKAFDPRVVDAFIAAVRANRDREVIVWTEHFSVGHEGMDRDHQKLFSILNQIWLDRKVGNRLILEMALDELMHYTRSHFAREEEYMKRFGYPEYAAHCRAHHSFSARVEALRWEYLHGLRNDIHTDLLDYLWQWLMNHIAEADKDYSSFIVSLAKPRGDTDGIAPPAAA